MKKGNKKKNKKSVTTDVIMILVFVIGLSLVLYPPLSNLWNEKHASKMIAQYKDIAKNLNTEEYEKILSDANEYNRNLSANVRDYKLTDSQIKEYDSLLNITGTGVMGYIQIPSINVELPIYHGTEERVLQVGTGHLEWSSLPVGGASTHSIISGHRGLPSAKLFSELDKMIEGDIFTITVLNETYTYEVDKITVVLPEDTSGLHITKGMDYVTLVTCTPYGINSHRLLVRGHRIDNIEGEARVTSEADVINPAIIALIILIILSAIIFPTSNAITKRKKRKN